MTTRNTHPLYAVQELLRKIVETNDGEKLGECLKGKHLTGVGRQDDNGYVYPADILWDALATARNILTFEVWQIMAQQLAELLAATCLKELTIIKIMVSEKATASDFLKEQDYLLNLFLFASHLPRHEKLFLALMEFAKLKFRLKKKVFGCFVLGWFDQALTCHQTDDRLEKYWLELIGRIGAAPLNAKENRFSAAWGGLLWIPPSTEDEKLGDTMSIVRVEKGLLALHKASVVSCSSLSVLSQAVDYLDQVYLRSPEFWNDKVFCRIEKWPEILRQIWIGQFPVLSE